MTQSNPTMTLVQDTAASAAAQVLAKVTAQLGTTKAAELAPIITQYGPAFAAMSATEIWDWINLAVQGDPAATYAAVVAKLPAQDLVNEWGSINAKWQSANTANAASVAWQKQALEALLQGLVAVAASMVAL